MSDSEIQRFVSDLKSDQELLAELSNHAAGVGSVVQFANERGYEITPDDVRNHIRASAGTDLTDAQLEKLAGGVRHRDPTATETVATATAKVNTNQSVSTNTSVNTTAEVLITAVAVVVLT